MRLFRGHLLALHLLHCLFPKGAQFRVCGLFQLVQGLLDFGLGAKLHLAHVHQRFLAEMLRHDFARNLRRFRRNPRQLVNLVLDPDRPVVLLQLLRAKGFARVRGPAHDVADTADLVEVLDQLAPRLQ